MADIYIAKQGAIVDYDGRPTTIKKGRTRVEAGHELLTRFPHLFEPAADGAEFRVSTTRAEPATEPKTPRSRKRGAKAAPPAVDQDAEPGSADGDGTEAAPEGQDDGDAASTPQDEAPQDVTPDDAGDTAPEGE